MTAVVPAFERLINTPENIRHQFLNTVLENSFWLQAFLIDCSSVDIRFVPHRVVIASSARSMHCLHRYPCRREKFAKILFDLISVQTRTVRRLLESPNLQADFKTRTSQTPNRRYLDEFLLLVNPLFSSHVQAWQARWPRANTSWQASWLSSKRSVVCDYGHPPWLYTHVPARIGLFPTCVE